MVIYSKPRGRRGRSASAGSELESFPLWPASLPHVSIKARQPTDKLALPRELSALCWPALLHTDGMLGGNSTGCGLAWITAGELGSEVRWGLGPAFEFGRRSAPWVCPTDAAQNHSPGVCGKLLTTSKMSEQLFLVLFVFY